MMGRCVTFVAVLFGVMAALSPARAETRALSTPPAIVSTMSQDELNAFGIRLANEAYAIMAHVGSAKGQIGGTPHQFNKNAVKNVKALFDDAALIQNARLNYGLTKATFAPAISMKQRSAICMSQIVYATPVRPRSPSR